MGGSRAPTSHQLQEVRLHVLKGCLDHGAQLQQHKCRSSMIEGPENGPTATHAWSTQAEPMYPRPAGLLSVGLRNWCCVFPPAIPAFQSPLGPRCCLGSYVLVCPLPYAQGAPFWPAALPIGLLVLFTKAHVFHKRKMESVFLHSPTWPASHY